MPHFQKLLIAVLLILLSHITQAQPYQMPVYTATSTRTPQPGSEVTYLIDGDDNTLYHSLWSAPTAIPDTISFYLANGVANITSIEYTPRLAGYNGAWTSVDFYYSTKAAPGTFAKINTAPVTWAADNAKKTYTLPAAISQPYIIWVVVNGAYANLSSGSEVRFYGTTPYSEPSSCTVASTPNLPADVQVSVSSGSATSFQNGANIDQSYDNDPSTIYHSNYSGGGFPIDLTYNFSNVPKIDYLEYTTRLLGDNGNFGQVEVYASTTASPTTFTKIAEYDCRKTNGVKRIYFPGPVLNPSSIRVRVLSGQNNLASCAEMRFYARSSAWPAPPAGIFANALCTALAAGVTQAGINNISNAFYKELAQCMYNGTYNAAERVRTYQPFPRVETVAAPLKLSTYDPFENPTGIYFTAGSKAVLFVENTGTVQLALTVVDIADASRPAPVVYPLASGLNEIPLTNSGLGYLNYYTDNSTAPAVKVHIVSGMINGVFNVATSTSADWTNLVQRSAYGMLDIYGKYDHLTVHRDALKAGAPLNGTGLINMYDSITYSEFSMMGLDKFNRLPKNHMYVWTAKDQDNPYASGQGVHLPLAYGYGLAGWTSVTNTTEDILWGLGHEHGHVNQLRPDLRWAGMGEVTNNIYSIWVAYNMARDHARYTRLEFNGTTENYGPGGVYSSAMDHSLIGSEYFGVHSDLYVRLIPFWQLELYYQLAGACRNAPRLPFAGSTATTHSNGIDYARWYGQVAEYARLNTQTGLTNGQHVLNFVKYACDAVHENLIDFFVKAGFLVPANTFIDGEQIIITQQDVDAAKAYIQAKGYSNPVSPVINYISANSLNAFLNKLPLSGTPGVGVSLNGTTLTVQTASWPNVVAYETYSQAGTLMKVSIVGTGDLSAATTLVPYPAAAGRVFAVGYDGNKIQVYPACTGNGSGLLAQYYNSPAGGTFPAAAPAQTRIDPTVNFNWGNDSPVPGTINTDNFKARWQGQVEAPYTGNYVFSVTGDDGYRLWVNGVLVLDFWNDQGPTKKSSVPIALNACQKYDIKLEYYENGGGATCKLEWTLPAGVEEVIPAKQLYAPGSTDCSVNVALGKTATATSVESSNAAFAASAAVDGSNTTRWSSSYNDNNALTIDLGGVLQHL